MTRQRTSRQRSSGKGVVARQVKTPAAALPAPSASPGEPLLQHKYRELIRKHDGKVLDALFAEFTGVHFHIAWTPALPRQWDAHTMPTGCSVCCRLTGSPLLAACRACGPRQLARALSSDGAGHRFTCRLGVRNYWKAIRVRDEMLGIAYLQALGHSPGPLAWKRSARLAHPRLRQAGANVLSRREFARAARLLQLIVEHVQTATLSDLRKADLTNAGRAVLALEQEQARLHLALNRTCRLLPRLPAAPARNPAPNRLCTT